MEYRPYDKVMLFMGVLSTKGFPSSLRERLLFPIPFPSPLQITMFRKWGKE